MSFSRDCFPGARLSAVTGNGWLLASVVVVVLLLGAGVAQGNGWKPMSSGAGVIGGIWGSSSNDVFAVGEKGAILRYDGAAWTPMVSGTTATFAGVWGSSSRDVFAVGTAGTILRYDGSAWTAMVSGTPSALAGIWGSSARDVFAVGEQGTILHFDGAAWVPMKSGVTDNVRGVWGASPTDVYAVTSFGYGYNGKILHYDGAAWTTVFAGTARGIVGIWGASASDVFAVGLGGEILHYDGSTWTAKASVSAYGFLGVWGSSSSDVYAVGGTGSVLHYNGSTWTPMTTGAPGYLGAIWGSSARDVYAAGWDGEILHCDGSQWTSALYFPSLSGVWGSSGSDVFAVGSRGSILHYDGAAWTPMTSGATDHLDGVWGSSASDVFAVGAAGRILRYNGTVWTPMNSGTTTNLNGVWGASASDVFAVGDNGTILHYDGAAWTPMSSGTTSNLYGIWGTPARIVFAVGDVGRIQRFNGSEWRTFASGDPSCIRWALNAVWGTSATDVYFVGGEGKILHYTGTALTTMVSGTESQLLGVWGTSSSDVSVVASGIILHYNGSTWTATSRPATMSGWLRGIWGLSPSAAFIVGSGRLILRYSTVNDAPTNITLFPATVGEGKPAGTTVGYLSTTDPDTGDSFTYTLADGPGSADNGSFHLAGGVLKTGAIFDCDVKKSFGIRVRSTDQGGLFTEKTFTVTVGRVNHAPVFLKGPDQTVLEDAGAQAVSAWAAGIGAGAAHEAGQTLSFVVTSDKSHLFAAQPAIAPDGTLRYTPAANVNGSTTLTVRLHDDGGTAYGGVDTSAPQTFVIAVTAVNDPPIFAGGGDRTVLEDSGAKTIFGWAQNIRAGLGETGQALNFIVTNDNSGLFAAQPAISSDGFGTLRFTPAADACGSALVTVRLHDDGGTANGGVDTSAPLTFTIFVTAVNDPPTLAALPDGTVAANAGLQTVILGGITAGPNESQTLAVTASSSNPALLPPPAVAYASPSATGSLSFTPVADAHGSATITVTVDDGQAANHALTRTFLVTVTPTPGAPTAIRLSSNLVRAGAPAGTRVGTLSTVDPESWDTFSYAIVGGDTALFRVEGNQLTTSQVLDYAVKNPYAVRIRSTDSSQLWTEQDFTVAPPAYVLWAKESTGQAVRWQVDPGTGAMKAWEWISPPRGVGAGWEASSYARGDALTDYVLWANSRTGQAIRWKIDPATGALKGWGWISPRGGVGAGWQASGYERGDATTDYVLWTKGSTGQAIRWQVDPDTTAIAGWEWISPRKGVGAGWQASSYLRGGTTDDVLWERSGTGQAVRWQIDPVTGAMTEWGWISAPAGVGGGWRATSYAESE